MNQERRASISVRLSPKTAKGHGGQTAHDLRTSSDLEYVNYSSSPRNSILIPPASGSELREICEQRRSNRETKRAMKANARVAFEGIITFSKLAQPIIEALPPAEQDEIFKTVAEKIAEYLNTTLHGLVVHRDESAIHCHFTLAGYDLSGNPLTQTVKRQQCIQIQDIAGEAVQHLGISRGKSKIERIKDGEPLNAYINRSVKELHNDLPEEIEALKQRIAELQEKERKNAERLEKTLQKLQEAEEENEKLKKRAETYQARLEKTQKELKKLQSEVERLYLLRQQLEQETQEANPIIEAIQQVAEQGWLASAQLKDDLGYYAYNKWTPGDSPPQIIRYNATLLDFESKLVAIGDGTPIQQAAAIYTSAREKGWEKTIFSGMDEAQIEWLVESAIKDGYEIDFEEEWAKAYAEKVREEISHKQRSMGWELEM